MPGEDKKITIADASHAQALTELSIVTFRDAFGPFNKQEDMDKYVAEEMNVEKLGSELADGDNLFFLAWVDDEMAGYAKLRLYKEPEELANNKPIELERIYVLQKYHGKKTGSVLMSRCIAHATANNHDILWLGVWEHNYNAIRFYEQWGFKLFGSHPFVLGNDNQTDVLMKKKL